MRYYKIEVTNAQTGRPILGADGSAFGPWSSLLVSGANNPGALDVQFDLPVNTFDLPISNGFVKLWGISVTLLGQASQFNPSLDFSSYCDIKIYGGMSKGLPLANPAQNGLLLDGAIQQAFGNWQGTQQTLDFVIIPNGGATGGYGSPQNPRNIVLNWQQGQQLGDAVGIALAGAFPGADVVGVNTLNQNLVLPYPNQVHACQTVAELAAYVSNISQTIVGGNYNGIKIVPTQTGFRMFDGTTQATPKQIQFVDLVGQPTWLDAFTVNFKCIMRADIAVGDYIQMPQVPATIMTPQSFSQYRQRATFQGTYLVLAVRHMGRFRQPNGDAWVTSIDALVSA